MEEQAKNMTSSIRSLEIEKTNLFKERLTTDSSAEEEIKSYKTSIELLELDRASLKSEIATLICSNCFPPIHTKNK